MGLEPTTPCLQSTPRRPWRFVGGNPRAGHKGYGDCSRTAGYVAGRDTLAPLLAPPDAVEQVDFGMRPGHSGGRRQRWRARQALS
jgi:hypothetical protein